MGYRPTAVPYIDAVSNVEFEFTDYNLVDKFLSKFRLSIQRQHKWKHHEPQSKNCEQLLAAKSDPMDCAAPTKPKLEGMGFLS